MGTDPREAPKRELSQQERETIQKLEADAELRHMATQVLLTVEDPNDSVRGDLIQHAIQTQGHNQRLTNVGATAIAERVMAEREAHEREIENLINSANTPNEHGQTLSDHLHGQLKEQEIDPKNLNLPELMPGERLKFVRHASTQDVARAGATQPYHHEVLKRGFALQSESNFRQVVAAAPGDLHVSKEGNQQRLERSQFDGCAIYEIVKD